MDRHSVVFMARQPICDAQGKLVAYELLFRNQEGCAVGSLSNEQEALSLVHALVDIGLDKLAGNLRAFVNIPTRLLSSPVMELLPTNRVVLEVLEDAPPTQATIDAIRALKSKGFTLALDDFVFGERDILLGETQIVKVEFPCIDPATLPAQMFKLRNRGTQVLAEKVETRDQYRRAVKAGFQFFQGFFFAEPELVHGQAAKPDNGTLMQLFRELQNPELRIVRVEQLLSADVRLAHQFLRAARTAEVGAGSGITSIREAALALGSVRMSAMVGLMLMAQRKGPHDHVVGLGLVRAKLCEELARKLNLPQVERHFTVGLLSVLDSVYGRPLAELLRGIDLAPDLKCALLIENDPGVLGITLRTAKAIERGKFEVLKHLRLDSKAISDSQCVAIQWAEDCQKNLAA